MTLGWFLNIWNQFGPHTPIGAPRAGPLPYMGMYPEKPVFGPKWPPKLLEMPSSDIFLKTRLKIHKISKDGPKRVKFGDLMPKKPIFGHIAKSRLSRFAILTKFASRKTLLLLGFSMDLLRVCFYGFLDMFCPYLCWVFVEKIFWAFFMGTFPKMPRDFWK